MAAIEYWKNKLTPYDAELFMMVESLTGKPCHTFSGESSRYCLVVDYSNRPEPEFVSAVMDAVIGRIGERFINLEDKADEMKFVVTIGFSTKNYPGLIKCGCNRKEMPDVGGKYVLKNVGTGTDIAPIRALQVKRDNVGLLMAFVGNGELEVEQNIDVHTKGKAVYHFINAGSVYEHADEFDYIVYVGPGRFEVVKIGEFERNYKKI